LAVNGHFKGGLGQGNSETRNTKILAEIHVIPLKLGSRVYNTEEKPFYVMDTCYAEHFANPCGNSQLDLC